MRSWIFSTIYFPRTNRVWMHVNEHKGKRTSRFPLALFSTPWVRDTAGTRHTHQCWLTLHERVCVWLCAALLRWSMMMRSMPSFSWLVDLRRLTVPLSIRSCSDRRVFRRLISLFSSSSWWHTHGHAHAHTHTHTHAHTYTPAHTHTCTHTHAHTHTHARTRTNTRTRHS